MERYDEAVGDLWDGLELDRNDKEKASLLRDTLVTFGKKKLVAGDLVKAKRLLEAALSVIPADREAEKLLSEVHKLSTEGDEGQDSREHASRSDEVHNDDHPSRAVRPPENSLPDRSASRSRKSVGSEERVAAPPRRESNRRRSPEVVFVRHCPPAEPIPSSPQTSRSCEGEALVDPLTPDTRLPPPFIPCVPPPIIFPPPFLPPIIIPPPPFLPSGVPAMPSIDQRREREWHMKTEALLTSISDRNRDDTRRSRPRRSPSVERRRSRSPRRRRGRSPARRGSRDRDRGRRSPERQQRERSRSAMRKSRPSPIVYGEDATSAGDRRAKSPRESSSGRSRRRGNVGDASHPPSTSSTVITACTASGQRKVVDVPGKGPTVTVGEAPSSSSKGPKMTITAGRDGRKIEVRRESSAEKMERKIVKTSHGNVTVTVAVTKGDGDSAVAAERSSKSPVGKQAEVDENDLRHLLSGRRRGSGDADGCGEKIPGGARKAERCSGDSVGARNGRKPIVYDLGYDDDQPEQACTTEAGHPVVDFPRDGEGLPDLRQLLKEKEGDDLRQVLEGKRIRNASREDGEVSGVRRKDSKETGDVVENRPVESGKSSCSKPRQSITSGKPKHAPIVFDESALKTEEQPTKNIEQSPQKPKPKESKTKGTKDGKPAGKPCAAQTGEKPSKSAERRDEKTGRGGGATKKNDHSSRGKGNAGNQDAGKKNKKVVPVKTIETDGGKSGSGSHHVQTNATRRSSSVQRNANLSSSVETASRELAASGSKPDRGVSCDPQATVKAEKTPIGGAEADSKDQRRVGRSSSRPAASSVSEGRASGGRSSVERKDKNGNPFRPKSRNGSDECESSIGASESSLSGGGGDGEERRMSNVETRAAFIRHGIYEAGKRILQSDHDVDAAGIQASAEATVAGTAVPSSTSGAVMGIPVESPIPMDLDSADETDDVTVANGTSPAVGGDLLAPEAVNLEVAAGARVIGDLMGRPSVTANAAIASCLVNRSESCVPEPKSSGSCAVQNSATKEVPASSLRQEVEGSCLLLVQSLIDEVEKSTTASFGNSGIAQLLAEKQRASTPQAPPDEGKSSNDSGGKGKIAREKGREFKSRRQDPRGELISSEDSASSRDGRSKRSQSSSQERKSRVHGSCSDASSKRPLPVRVRRGPPPEDEVRENSTRNRGSPQDIRRGSARDPVPPGAGEVKTTLCEEQSPPSRLLSRWDIREDGSVDPNAPAGEVPGQSNGAKPGTRGRKPGFEKSLPRSPNACRNTLSTSEQRKSSSSRSGKSNRSGDSCEGRALTSTAKDVSRSPRVVQSGKDGEVRQGARSSSSSDRFRGDSNRSACRRRPCWCGDSSCDVSHSRGLRSRTRSPSSRERSRGRERKQTDCSSMAPSGSKRLRDDSSSSRPRAKKPRMLEKPLSLTEVGEEPSRQVDMNPIAIQVQATLDVAKLQLFALKTSFPNASEEISVFEEQIEAFKATMAHLASTTHSNSNDISHGQPEVPAATQEDEALPSSSTVEKPEPSALPESTVENDVLNDDYEEEEEDDDDSVVLLMSESSDDEDGGCLFIPRPMKMSPSFELPDAAMEEMEVSVNRVTSPAGFLAVSLNLMSASDRMASGDHTRLQAVYMEYGAYCSALTHAGSTNTHEIVGLMIGKILRSQSGPIAVVSSCLSLVRPERWSDRVEILPDRLADAMSMVDELGEKFKEKFQVLGWYHSHPRITVEPSVVDLRTQHSFQNLDEHFSGVIFALYTDKGAFVRKEHAADSPMLRMRAFQATFQGGDLVEVSIPFEIAPRVLSPPRGSSAMGMMPSPAVPMHCFEAIQRNIDTLREEEKCMASFKNGTGVTDVALDKYSEEQNLLVYATSTRQIIQSMLLPLQQFLQSYCYVSRHHLNDG